MLILSVDSSSQTASVSLSNDSSLLGCVTLNIGNKHSATLLPAVSFLFSAAGLQASDVGLFALAAGPGSFTGVRIGAATLKGIALGNGAPCIGVSTLETLAEGTASFDGILCPMINARRDRYFTASFSAESGRISRLTEDDTVSGDNIEKYILSQNRRVYLSGDGVDLFLENHPEAKYACTAASEMLRYPSAYYAGILALRKYESADEEERSGFTAESLRPVYLRRPQAERELLERHGN